MRSLLSAAEVAGCLTWEPIVSSWLGGRWLADIPVMGGSDTVSVERTPPGSLDLVVPRETTRCWLPDGPQHPLAHYGQVLRVSLRITREVDGSTETIPLGVRRITRWEDAGAAVRITAVSMAHTLEDDKFECPTPTRADGTFRSEVTRVVPSTLGVWVSPDLADRPVPAMSWAESRVDALSELCRAWPARWREDESGTIRIMPTLFAPARPMLTLTDYGTTGTMSTAYTSGGRAGVYTVVVARGEASSDMPTIQSVAAQHGGPYDVDTYGRVVRYFTSPLLTTVGQCAQAAESLLEDELRSGTTVPVECAPDARVQVDDYIEVRMDQGRRRIWGWVTGTQVPLVADAPMRLDVAVAVAFEGDAWTS